MSLDFMRTIEFCQVPDQLQDDGNPIQPCFEESRPLPPVKWSEPEHADLATLMRPVTKYSQWWVDYHAQELRQRGITLTYDLLSESESYSSNASASHQDLVGIGEKRKEIVPSTEPASKRHKGEPSRSAASRNIDELVATIDESLVEILEPPAV